MKAASEKDKGSGGIGGFQKKDGRKYRRCHQSCQRENRLDFDARRKHKHKRILGRKKEEFTKDLLHGGQLPLRHGQERCTSTGKKNSV